MPKLFVSWLPQYQEFEAFANGESMILGMPTHMYIEAENQSGRVTSALDSPANLLHSIPSRVYTPLTKVPQGQSS